ncbi:MAG TPA: SRPBCC family protein [Rhodocyclaceae bacterium]|nr:SRPBCC family protein [Rhodocyclaceae bacterium]
MDKPVYGRSASLIAGVGIGALLMYLFGDQGGRRRVALMRDRTVRLARRSREFADVGARDLANRACGVLAQVHRALQRVEPVNEVLIDRVRAQLGRLVSHPHAIHVTAAGGHVTLSGPVLESEERQLVRGVQAVRGVHLVENRLDAHRTDEHMPALQGGKGQPAAPRLEFMQANWAPGPRLLAVAAGAVLAGLGLSRRGLAGKLLGLAGVGLAARAATNTEMGQLLGIPGRRRGWTVQKTITIAAPRDMVFDLWSSYDNFPHFMSFVEEVHRIDDSRSHWKVKGPAGTHFEWDAAITEHRRPERLAWRSEPGAALQHGGSVRFEEVEGGTRVTVCLSYNPPGGAVAHSLAAFLGRDPKGELDADLMRMKSFLETGKPAHDAAEPAMVPLHPPAGFEMPSPASPRPGL